MEIMTKDFDEVLKSHYLTGVATYEYALQYLYPLINRSDFQRKIQDPKFYKRLEKDLLKGCIMPPITIAFITDEFEGKFSPEINTFSEFINTNISEAYILDGIQRLNTLYRSSTESGFQKDRKIYLNIIISHSEDFLLYRMITLNNGQKPMSPRHQIEILTQNMFNFPSFSNIKIQTEKESSLGKIANTFKYADIAKCYLAFLTNNVNNDNSKIIAEEMDKIIVNRIMETGLPEDVSFFSYLQLIDKFCENKGILTWFSQANNLIGAVVGMKFQYEIIQSYEIEQLNKTINLFETNFKLMVNKSKINMGKTRREYVCTLFKKIADTIIYSDTEMRDFIASMD